MNTTSSRRVLILGAAGRFGAAATTAFAAAGWQVLAQARRAPAALPPGACHLAVSLQDTAALVRAAAGARAVVHAVNPLYTAWGTQMLPLARLGMDAAEQLGATFMFPGNVYHYGTSLPALLAEGQPARPDTVKGRLRAELEAEIAARGALGLRSVIIRAGDFFGGGRGNWFDEVIVKSLAKGKLVYPGPLDLPHAWAYLPDLARAFVAAAQCEELQAVARLHFAGHTLTGRALLQAIERAARSIGAAGAAPLAHGSVPWWLLRAGGFVVPMWRELAEMAYLWRTPHALDGRRMRAILGPLPQTPLDDALAAALVDLGFARPERQASAHGSPPVPAG